MTATNMCSNFSGRLPELTSKLLICLRAMDAPKSSPVKLLMCLRAMDAPKSSSVKLWMSMCNECPQELTSKAMDVYVQWMPLRAHQ